MKRSFETVLILHIKKQDLKVYQAKIVQLSFETIRIA